MHRTIRLFRLFVTEPSAPELFYCELATDSATTAIRASRAPCVLVLSGAATSSTPVNAASGSR